MDPRAGRQPADLLGLPVPGSVGTGPQASANDTGGPGQIFWAEERKGVRHGIRLSGGICRTERQGVQGDRNGDRQRDGKAARIDPGRPGWHREGGRRRYGSLPVDALAAWAGQPGPGRVGFEHRPGRHGCHGGRDSADQGHAGPVDRVGAEDRRHDGPAEEAIQWDDDRPGPVHGRRPGHAGRGQVIRVRFGDDPQAGQHLAGDW